jgi:hypothetical protein
MEAWYTLVRNMKDESSNAFKLEEFVRRVFHDLSRKKLKEKVKFRQRMGPEFISWSSGLEQEFAKTMVTEVLNDDTFWEATLQVTGVL